MTNLEFIKKGMGFIEEMEKRQRLRLCAGSQLIKNEDGTVTYKLGKSPYWEELMKRKGEI